jgi:hypothetical protein
MKTHSIRCALFLSLALASGVACRAGTPAAAPVAAPELTVVFVDALGENPGETGNFDRVSRIFTNVFEQRKWPVKINFERFGAGGPEHPLEFKIFFQGMRSETPADLTFKAWMTLNNHGTKLDFGIVKYRYDTRIGEAMDDRLDRTVDGAAVIAADKIEAVLFPKAAPPKS